MSPLLWTRLSRLKSLLKRAILILISNEVVFRIVLLNHGPLEVKQLALAAKPDIYFVFVFWLDLVMMFQSSD